MLALIPAGRGGGRGPAVEFFFHGFKRLVSCESMQHGWQVQRPTRFTWLGIWGCAGEHTTVEHLQIHGVDQLMGAVPAEMFAPMIPLEVLLSDFGEVTELAPGIFESQRSDYNAAERLSRSPGLQLQMPSLSVGHRVAIEIKGPFQACVLFGMEVP